MTETKYDEFVRSRITELRIKKNVSEHKMSLDLDKSGSYIRNITNGTALNRLVPCQKARTTNTAGSTKRKVLPTFLCWLF